MTAVYTLWARLPEDEGAWMIAAEDEWCWEFDPDRCETKFKAARDEAERGGLVVREVWFHFDQEKVEAAFRVTEISVDDVEARAGASSAGDTETTK